MKKMINVTNILFILILLLELLPDQRIAANSGYLVALVGLIHLYYMLNFIFRKDSSKVETVGDVTAIVYGVLLLWELSTAKLNLVGEMLYPAPGPVIALFIVEIPEFLKGLASSMQLLLAGYLLALVIAVPLALLIGWRQRLFKAVKPLTKVLGPIPPIVFIPYAIGILPTFKTASIFVIFIGAFWPIFINTLNGVFSVEKKIVDSAKALNISEKSMLFEIILPATLPSIISGSTIGLVLSFILLTAAEMIGATSGLGWYVKYFSDFADYPRVIVGIIYIGIVVTGITHLFDKLEAYLLRWRK